MGVAAILCQGSSNHSGPFLCSSPPLLDPRHDGAVCLNVVKITVFFGLGLQLVCIGEEGKFMEEPGTAVCNPAKDGKLYDGRGPAGARSLVDAL